MQASPSWKGRIWARTSCDFTKTAPPACETGDCAGKLACNGSIGLPPATLVEFSLEPDRTQPSFYDVSLVDGYNLPVAVSPSKGGKPQLLSNCTINGCSRSLTSGSNCPPELQVVSTERGEVVACKSACLAFNLDDFCCRNEYGIPEKCRPSMYSRLFKDACPSYFSYAYDGAPSTPLRSCSSDEYAIIFCPSSWAADA
ncbi:Thaumatin-like protein [Nymphaea thermarum]|nr:Thaumatin-like protein [Nymphaea thermarum]